MSEKSWERVWLQLVVRAWEDDDFMKELMHSPRDVLKREGIEIPSNVNVQVHEQTDKRIHLVMPCRPIQLEKEYIDELLSDCCATVDTSKPTHSTVSLVVCGC